MTWRMVRRLHTLLWRHPAHGQAVPGAQPAKMGLLMVKLRPVPELPVGLQMGLPQLPTGRATLPCPRWWMQEARVVRVVRVAWALQVLRVAEGPVQVMGHHGLLWR
jgi:hypothetical protein